MTEKESAEQSLGDLLKGTPFDEDAVHKATFLIGQCSLTELQRLGLSAPAKLSPPRLPNSMPPGRKLARIQTYIEHFQYNYAPGYHFNVSKKRPFSQLMRTAKTIIHAELPIKCIEAVLIGMYLTAGWETIERWTLSFKTGFQSHSYRHIVLVIHDRQSCLFAAVGISRQPSLMYKPLQYTHLSSLVDDFLHSYASLGHEIQNIRFSLPVEHDVHYTGDVGWNCCILHPASTTAEQLQSAIESYCAGIPKLVTQFRRRGVAPHFHPS